MDLLAMYRLTIFILAVSLTMPSWAATVVNVVAPSVQQIFGGSCNPKVFTPAVIVQINYYNPMSIPSSLNGSSSGSSFSMSNVVQCDVAGHVSFYQSAGNVYAVQIDDARSITGYVVVYLMYMNATDSGWRRGETVN